MRHTGALARLLAIGLAALPQIPWAQVSATRQDWCTGGGREESCTPVSTVSVHFAIPAADAGKPGAFFIAARATSGEPGNTRNINLDTVGLWLYTQDGWVAFNGGRYTPIEAFSALPSTRSYIVVDRQDLCQFVGEAGLELWAGYGVLQADKQSAINTYYATATPNVPADHLRAVFIYSDMKDNGRYWNVLTRQACTSGGSGSGSFDNGQD